MIFFSFWGQIFTSTFSSHTFIHHCKGWVNKTIFVIFKLYHKIPWSYTVHAKSCAERMKTKYYWDNQGYWGYRDPLWNFQLIQCLFNFSWFNFFKTSWISCLFTFNDWSQHSQGNSRSLCKDNVIIVTIFPLHTLIAYRAPTRNAFCAMEMFLIAKLQAGAYIVPA